jgi:hypothetical protein
MRTPTRFIAVAVIACGLALSPRLGHAQSAAGHPNFSPVVAAAPAGIAKVLVPDSTVASSMGNGLTPRIGEENNGCRVVLLDRKSGSRYLLIQSQLVEDRVTSRGGRTVRTSESQGNYVLMDGRTEINTPLESTQSFLRVACGTNEVLGLAHLL